MIYKFQLLADWYRDLHEYTILVQPALYLMKNNYDVKIMHLEGSTLLVKLYDEVLIFVKIELDPE